MEIFYAKLLVQPIGVFTLLSMVCTLTYNVCICVCTTKNYTAVFIISISMIRRVCVYLPSEIIVAASSLCYLVSPANMCSNICLLH